jgi:hypothetical protein
MASSITHEQYVKSVRERIYAIALGMLNDEIPFLEGARKLASLSHEAEADGNDEDFRVFVGIASETDDLPIGPSRKYWAKEALEKHQPMIEETTRWAKQIGTSACQSLATRFNAEERTEK